MALFHQRYVQEDAEQVYLASSGLSPTLRSAYDRTRRSLQTTLVRKSVRLLVGCLAFLGILVFLLPYDASRLSKVQYSSTPSTPSEDGSKLDSIPNVVHFVYVLSNPAADFSFQFKHYLSAFSAWHHWQPEKIFIHTNAHDESIARAQNGASGKWSQLIFDLPLATVNRVTVPTHANNGKEIQGMEHKSDFVRVNVLHEHGGVYIDLDVYPLRDIKILRESGFKGIAGRQVDGQINSGVFMTAKRGKMMRLWKEGMHDKYTGGWTDHSNEVITRVGQRLTREPGEMLIMEHDAFAPSGWYEKDEVWLWETHEDAVSNLANFTQGDELPSYEEVDFDRWTRDDGQPEWARDWSYTYMLHAFNPERFSKDAEKYYRGISPRNVLERRSNFARAVYPVAKVMYDKGLIEIDDSPAASRSPR